MKLTTGFNSLNMLSKTVRISKYLINKINTNKNKYLIVQTYYS